MNTDDDILAQFKYARYSRKPFPPYRYRPGVHPHPTASPMGHSYLPTGTPAPRVTWQPPEHWNRCEEYLHGCDLYNHAYWWEAHEEWEGFWHTCPKSSAQRHFLQGLIQISACHLKLHLGHLDGVARLRDSSQKHLSDALSLAERDEFMGLSVTRFISDVQAYYDAVHARYAPAHDPSVYPYLHLPVAEVVTD